MGVPAGGAGGNVAEAPTATGLPAGTPVLTPRGPVAVEDLRPGTLVLSVSGIAAPFQPVVALHQARHAGPLVRIRAGALADGAPDDDLLLPVGHALLVDGALVNAGELVDGHGVVAEPEAAPVTLVSLVLEAHDAVLAAGAAVETAMPDPPTATCAPRCPPDATLRALLAWRAEAMGWATPAAPADAAPEIGTLRERLAASPLTPAAPWPPVKPPR